MLPFLSKKSKIKLQILAWYQIAGGIIGLMVTLWLLINTEGLSGPVLFIYLLVFALYGGSIYGGRLLITDKYARGLNLTIVNQLLQVISCSMLGYGFMYIAGAMLLAEIKVENGFKLAFNFGLFSKWNINIATNEKPFQLGVNFAAIYWAYFADKLKTTIKMEKAAYVEISQDGHHTLPIVD